MPHYALIVPTFEALCVTVLLTLCCIQVPYLKSDFVIFDSAFLNCFHPPETSRGRLSEPCSKKQNKENTSAFLSIYAVGLKKKKKKTTTPPSSEEMTFT